MQKKRYSYSSGAVAVYSDATLAGLDKVVSKDSAVYVTDEHLRDAWPKFFRNRRTIVLPAGEAHKQQATVDRVIDELIGFGADRGTTLVGVGGGVVTDITGYAASVYMRGIPFGFAPASVLAMVDAAIGGKNGVDVGVYKNLVGTIRQPKFLLYDVGLLRTLPEAEWVNGFAEIIKHAVIRDAALFRGLRERDLAYYRRNKTALAALIRRNVMIKSAVVKKDEFEQGDRRLLNFGHTLGHAVENVYGIPHGHAVSIGMKAACLVSEQLLDFTGTPAVAELLSRYSLPVDLAIDPRRVFDVMRLDKKKSRDTMNYVLLEKIGRAVVRPIKLDELEKLLYSIYRAR